MATTGRGVKAHALTACVIWYVPAVEREDVDIGVDAGDRMPDVQWALPALQLAVIVDRLVKAEKGGSAIRAASKLRNDVSAPQPAIVPFIPVGVAVGARGDLFKISMALLMKPRLVADLRPAWWAL